MIWDRVRRPGEVLKLYHEEMQKNNPKFSLRSFALFLDLSPSFLSHVMTGRKKISSTMAKPVAQKLKLKAIEAKLFLLFIELELASLEVKPILISKAEALISKLNTRHITPEASMDFMNWYHHSILVALSLHNYLDTKGISSLAAYLNLDKSEVQKAVKDLVYVGLLIQEGKSYKRSEKQLVFSSQTTNQILRKMHRDYLKRATSLISSRGPEARFSVTEFFSIPAEQFPIIKEKIGELLDEISFRGPERPLEGVLELALHLNFTSKADIFNEN
jgi:uncharacterized protein (TIGR02147 family)